ncbi:MAG: DUF3987 domain-containing protein ['Candidatus Kapabacteria' thiocyanatum]|uniref:DUF3987 domain-containing protein n=1 Tax=Candidatus Kapaibacterium thiocyanatum TaxID=1895771 RepID=A0A1M3KZ11_9BACT|nr:DUF3987 domain-containing protein ['Candidatus Kapabacteria' thiocyanatum]OJX57737.1 MAG: hypothetical protein BGO89_07130 ['Candidatus Kapabacteria' thiocyanatum]
MTTLSTNGVRREHLYHDKDGNVLYRVCIIKYVDREKDVFAQQWMGTTFSSKMNGLAPVLYRLPGLLQGIKDGKQIVIVEGEKDADTLVALGLVATTATYGAEKWPDDHSRTFAGADILIIPDLDEKGRKHGNRVSASLLKHGPPASLRVLNLHDLDATLPEKSDVTDYLERGGSMGTLLAYAETLPDMVPHEEEPPRAESHPVVPADVYDHLPQPLAGIVQRIDDMEERSTLLLACIVISSAVLPNVFFRYHHDVIYAPLYLFIVGPAGSGKGIARYALDLTYVVEERFARIQETNMARYNRELEAYRKSVQKPPRGTPSAPRSDLPVMPERRCLVAPADSTAPSINLLLATNGSILISDSEADTLATALNGDHGDLSPTLRKAFSHEPLSLSRVQDRRFVTCPRPRLAILLSGTPKQLLPLLRSTENGLTSRFLFHLVKGRDAFLDPFTNHGHDIRETIRAVAPDVDELYAFLSSLPEDAIEFRLTKEQKREFNVRYGRWKGLSVDDHGSMSGAIHRLGISEMRIAMILTVLRHWQAERTEMPRLLICSEEDYRTASLLANYFLQTTGTVMGYLPEQMNPALSRLPNRTADWYAALPEEVTTNEAASLGEQYGVARRTVERTLGNPLLFERSSRARYRKAPS